MHRSPNGIETCEDERIEVVVGRPPERRGEQHGARRARLMVIVDDLRKPLVEQHAVDIGGLRQRRHVKITVVVVPRILLVQDGQAPRTSVQWIGLAHVPVGDQLHSVGVHLNRQ